MFSMKLVFLSTKTRPPLDRSKWILCPGCSGDKLFLCFEPSLFPWPPTFGERRLLRRRLKASKKSLIDIATIWKHHYITFIFSHDNGTELPCKCGKAGPSPLRHMVILVGQESLSVIRIHQTLDFCSDILNSSGVCFKMLKFNIPTCGLSVFVSSEGEIAILLARKDSNRSQIKWFSTFDCCI